jgi:hypothetical protein
MENPIKSHEKSPLNSKNSPFCLGQSTSVMKAQSLGDADSDAEEVPRDAQRKKQDREYWGSIGLNGYDWLK